MEQRRTKAGRRDLQPADHRIAPAHLDEVAGVVVEREQPRRLQPDRGQVTGAVDGAVHAVIVLPHLDTDLALVPAVEAEREPHDAVEPAARPGPLTEPEQGRFAERELTERDEGEAAGHAPHHAPRVRQRGRGRVPAVRSLFWYRVTKFP